jgi:hypothetical protein
MTQLAAFETIAELDYRECNGVTISLQWSRHSNRLSVVVEDNPRGESFTVPARPENALEIFHHPYAYARPLRQPDAALTDPPRPISNAGVRERQG